MAASTYACATGSVSDVLRSEEDRRLLQRFRKRKKTVYWDSAVRCAVRLFVDSNEPPGSPTGTWHLHNVTAVTQGRASSVE
jgi:hypothetical protein